MAIYLYCVLRATREPPAGLRGIDAAPVRSVDLSGFGAWVSDVAATAIIASPERAQEHDRVVRAALEQETPLPARFGQVVAGESELRATLSERRTGFQAALDRVEGAVEMTIRLLVPSATGEERRDDATPVEGNPSGRRYLERLAAARREERNVLAKAALIRERVSAVVGQLVRAQAFASAGAGSSLITLSHLVPRENIAAYRNALLALRKEDPALAIMVSGPWAPYSFTEGLGA